MNASFKLPFLLAYESRMFTLEELLLALDALTTQRAQVAGAGWFLQHCWLVQVKPGGTARTNCKYWQVRSRQPIFDGKRLRHLKPDEVEAYRAAIDRGRQLQQIDRQIEKLHQQLQQLTPTADSLSSSSSSSSEMSSPETPLQISTRPTGALQPPQEQTQSPVKFTNLAEQERLVHEVLVTSRALRQSFQRAAARNQRLRARIMNLGEGHLPIDEDKASRR